MAIQARATVFGATHPELEIELIRTTWDDQVDVLHDGRVDVSIVRLPIDQAGLTVRPLFEEPRVAMLPSDHRLAGKPVIDITDLADEHLLQDPDAVPEWRDIAVELRTRTAKPIPVLHSVEERSRVNLFMGGMESDDSHHSTVPCRAGKVTGIPLRPLEGRWHGLQ